MEFGLKGTSRVCRGRHGEVGIVEFGLYRADGDLYRIVRVADELDNDKTTVTTVTIGHFRPP